MNRVKIFISAIFALTYASAHDEEGVIRLICEIDYSVDQHGSRSETFGEDLYTVTPIKGVEVTISKYGFGALFSGTMTEEKIRGTAVFEIDGKKYRRTIEINRYTGEFDWFYLK
jgi:hypothetical protein